MRDLEELIKLGLDRVVDDKHLRESFERTMQPLIEPMVNLMRHIVAGLDLDMVMYYRDYVNLTVKGNTILSSVAEQLRSFITIGRSLTHRYRNLDYRKLLNEASKLLRLANQLTHEVRNF